MEKNAQIASVFHKLVSEILADKLIAENERLADAMATNHTT